MAEYNDKISEIKSEHDLRIWEKQLGNNANSNRAYRQVVEGVKHVKNGQLAACTFQHYSAECAKNLKGQENEYIASPVSVIIV
jgi:hypothetical protein